MYPHYACEDGEDETGCFEEYKRKGYASQSAFYTCQSVYHNDGNDYAIYKPEINLRQHLINWMQATIQNKDGKLSRQEVDELKDTRWQMILDLTKIQIQHTPPVVIQAVRCNGIPECWKGTDEINCGLSWRNNLALGK